MGDSAALSAVALQAGMGVNQCNFYINRISETSPQSKEKDRCALKNTERSHHHQIFIVSTSYIEVTHLEQLVISDDIKHLNFNKVLLNVSNHLLMKKQQAECEDIELIYNGISFTFLCSIG